VVGIVNIRMVYPRSLGEAREEICRIEMNVDAMQDVAYRAVQFCVLVEDVPRFVASIIKQEMLSVGGDVVVYEKVVNSSLENTNAFIMGNLAQINKIIGKLASQPGMLADIGFEIQFVMQTVEKKEAVYYECGKYRLAVGKKTYLMGILNITADSFSGDGILAKMPKICRDLTVGASNGLDATDKEAIIEAACCKAERMVADGADIIDVGGESTRPGYTAVDDKEEVDRILGVVEKLVKTLNVPISVDTSKLYVAENVLKAGVHIINDVNGLIKEPKIAKLAASYNAGVIAMHNPDEPICGDVISCITKSLRKSVDIAIKAGVKRENILLDPGIGFGKTVEQNLEVMRRLDELKCLGYPVLLGTSRKSMIGRVLDLPVNERVEGTAATVALGIAKGVDFIRVHDVKEMHRVVKMSDAIVRGI